MNNSDKKEPKKEENQSSTNPPSDQLSQQSNESTSAENQPDKESKADQKSSSTAESSQKSVQDTRLENKSKASMSPSAKSKSDVVSDRAPKPILIDQASKQSSKKTLKTKINYVTPEGIRIATDQRNPAGKRFNFDQLSIISIPSEENPIDHSRKNKSKVKRIPSFYECIKVRNLVTSMLFLGMITTYLLRTNVAFVLATEAIGVRISKMYSGAEESSHGCQVQTRNTTKHSPRSGTYVWTTKEQSKVIDSFLLGYLISQIPTGIFARRIGFKVLLGIGMLVNTISGFLIPLFTLYGRGFLVILRFLQGLGEATFIPCTHWILTNWTPPNERGRRVAIVYSGAPIGIALALSSSFVVVRNEVLGGWPSLFYFCSTIGIFWLIGFCIIVTDDPAQHNRISNSEKHDIMTKLWGLSKPQEKDIPWRRIFKSAPFRAVLVGQIGYCYGLTVLMIEIPKFMHEFINYDVNKNGYIAALPFGIMSVFAVLIGLILDEMITELQVSGTSARKIAQGIGQFGPAICLVAVSFSQCNELITLSLLTAGIGLNGSAYPGVITNNIDISPCFAGLIIALTNSIAQCVTCLGTTFVDFILHINPSIFGWQMFFISCAAIYILCTIIFLIYATSKVQPWDRDFNR